MKKLFSFLLVAFMAIGFIACNSNKTVTGGPYKVGDYYNDGTKEGIVFVVYDGGHHGKIVSVDESSEQWAVDDVYVCAISEDGGLTNMRKIMKQPNWKSNYPAFAWCASLGEGWYLPAVDELLLIYQNKSIINRRLNKRGYGEIVDSGYWSSTEHVEFSSSAWNVFMDYGFTIIGNTKPNLYSVRAVSAF